MMGNWAVGTEGVCYTPMLEKQFQESLQPVMTFLGKRSKIS